MNTPRMFSKSSPGEYILGSGGVPLRNRARLLTLVMTSYSDCAGSSGLIIEN